MQKQRNDLKAGIFIIISMILIVAVIIGIKGIGRVLEPSQQPTITFQLTDDIGGLRPGSDVRIGGFKVGVVRDIEIVERAGETAYIRVKCSLPARFQIRTDARVRVQDTLTGSSWLNFDSLGSPDASGLTPNDVLVGRPSVMSSILASAGEIAPEVRDTVRDVRTVTLPTVNQTVGSYKTTSMHATAFIKYIRSKVDPIVDRYYAIADAGRGAAEQVRDLFGESKGDFKQTVANLNSATATVKDKLPGIMDKVDGGLTKVQAALDSANVALEDIKSIASNTKDATGSVRSILVSNRGKIDGMISSLKTTGDNLKYASVEIRHSPWRLLYKPTPGELVNLHLYDSARQFAEGANQLSEAATALRDALKDPDVKPEQVQSLVEKLDRSFANFGQIEQELWKQVR